MVEYAQVLHKIPAYTLNKENEEDAVRFRPDTQRNMFTLAGWLFADMFLALTMLFLITSAIGTYIPTKNLKATATPTPRLVGMDTTPVTVNFTVDENGLLNNSPAAVAVVKSQVHNQLKGYLKGHPNAKAAFVSTFGGGYDDGIDTAEAKNINAILQQMGREQYYVFDRNDVIYNNYVNRSASFGAIFIQIFFFLYTK